MIKKTFLGSVAVAAMTIRAFNAEACPTVTVGGVRMNKSDYDPEEHGPVDEGSDEKRGDDVFRQLHKEQAERQGREDDAARVAGTTASLDDGRDAEQRRIDERISKSDLGSMQDGKKFYVIDTLKLVDGKPSRVDDIPGINPKGYKSNKDAWDAILSVRQQNTDANTFAAGTTGIVKGSVAEGDGEGGEGGNEPTATPAGDGTNAELVEQQRADNLAKEAEGAQQNIDDKTK